MTNFKEKFIYYRDLIWNLAISDLRIRYKQTYLRGLWAIIQPLATLFILTVVFSHIAKVSSEGIPYPLFSYTALLPWSFFATCFITATSCMQKNQSLITRINFPKITVPLGAILASMFDFLISFIIFIAIMCYHKMGFNLKMLLFIPIFLLQLMFVAGVVLIAVTFTAYIRDFRQAASVIIRLWMLASPVGYSLKMVPEKFMKFYLLNPMAGFLDSYRKVLIHNQFPDIRYLGTSTIISVIVLFFGLWFFKKNEPIFADIV